jgi:Mrp family chromosome partitioning ATPase
VILVDTPPLGAGVDSYTLGTLTSNMMLVLRTGATNLELARTKLAMLSQFPIRVLGVVLNDVRPGQMYGYFYSYIPGYGATDESGAAVTQRRMQGVV